MSDNCGVIRSLLSFANDHSSANSSSSRLTPESRLQTIIVSRALPRTFWRVKFAYEFWHDHLRPLDFHLKAVVLEYPGHARRYWAHSHLEVRQIVANS